MRDVGAEADRLPVVPDLDRKPKINILLSQILAQTARVREGEALLKQAMELEPDHGGVMIALGDSPAGKGGVTLRAQRHESSRSVARSVSEKGHEVVSWAAL